MRFVDGRIVIGVDEAGYGPSMGPLVIAATAWWVPNVLVADQLAESFADCFQPKPSLPRGDFLSIGDSKKILIGKYGWPSLSLAAQWILRESMRQASESASLRMLLQDDWSRLQTVPWYRDLTQGSQLPVHRYLGNQHDSSSDSKTRDSLLATISPKISERLASSGVKLLDTQARCIDEPEFNRLVSLSGNKSTVLSDLSLSLAKSIAIRAAATAAEFLNTPQSHPARLKCIEMFFDKHGGRNRYQALLMNAFDGVWVECDCEGPRISTYRAKWGDYQIQFSFRVGGDSLIPSGAASVIAKWVREHSMASLNAYWEQEAKEQIRPTAGYYVDALRFAEEIDSTAIRLGLARDMWWRSK
ncbi:hypothetical protein SH501x_000587 [Pirellulaceae bacterium SH501]